MGDGNWCCPIYDTCFRLSCQQFCSLLHCSRSRVPRLRRIGPICLLPAAEDKKASSLPLVEQWEEYVVPNHSWFPAIDDKDFLAGTRVMAALDKVVSHYLRTDFCRDARRFLKENVNCVLSNVASKSVTGQGLSCFCPAIVVGGEDFAPFQLFNKLLDGLLEKGRTRGAKLRRAGLSTSPLCRNSGSWRGRPQGAALTKVTSCHSVLHRLVSALVGTCVKYVSCPFKRVASTPMSCPVL